MKSLANLDPAETTACLSRPEAMRRIRKAATAAAWLCPLLAACALPGGVALLISAVQRTGVGVGVGGVTLLRAFFANEGSVATDGMTGVWELVESNAPAPVNQALSALFGSALALARSLQRRSGRLHALSIGLHAPFIGLHAPSHRVGYPHLSAERRARFPAAMI